MFKYMSVQVDDYRRFKESLDVAMNGAADHMVRVGYLLMQARDTDILKESGYAGMGEFAQKEYGLTPDQTSRFIGIAERFGDGEGRLQDKWQQFGYSKLSEMLTLPEKIAEEIPAEVTREEIRELKAEVKAEQEITPIEAAIEEAEVKAADPEAEDEPILKRFFMEYFRVPEHAEEFVRAMLADWTTIWNPGEESARKCVLDALAPSGIAILEARIPGKGRYMLSFKGEETKPVFMNIREEAGEEVSWLEVRLGFSDIHEDMEGEWEKKEAEEAKSMWSVLYGADFPKKAEQEVPEKKQERKVKIAPAQSKKKNEQKPAKSVQKTEKEDEKGEKISKMPQTTSASDQPQAAAPTACQPAAPVDVWDGMNKPADEEPLPKSTREYKIGEAVKVVNRLGLDLKDYAEKLEKLETNHNYVYVSDLAFDFGESYEKIRSKLEELTKLMKMRWDAEIGEDEPEECEETE